MAQTEQQQLLAAAEPEECSRSAMIFLVGCTVPALFSIAIFLVIMWDSNDDCIVNDLKVLALTLLIIFLPVLTYPIVGLVIGMRLQRHNGNHEGERRVDELLLLW